ncbi:hypothetical protein I302_101248 [Kwoniella bestiolae CBS 10118]|uniref:Uncharacterized protein n=1 Tax=Kwoniella bestiolae CBS 10118 TaxID=1296100 RepID=A0A1B9G7C1_9TREE|nr:hypothetical protein I302_04620 [Kwoniella bestiolae CBS 10118]OCF26929.1 hypothetical protein I302_04620 [Kwoniella bestiolae CBS 10118]
MATIGGRFSARFGSSVGSGFRRGSSSSWTCGGSGTGSRTGNHYSNFYPQASGKSNGPSAKQTIETLNNANSVYRDCDKKASASSSRYGSFLSAGTGQPDVSRSNTRPAMTRSSSIVSQSSASSSQYNISDHWAVRASLARSKKEIGENGSSVPEEESDLSEFSDTELEEETNGDGGLSDSHASFEIDTGEYLSSDATSTVQDSRL